MNESIITNGAIFRDIDQEVSLKNEDRFTGPIYYRILITDPIRVFCESFDLERKIGLKTSHLKRMCTYGRIPIQLLLKKEYIETINLNDKEWAIVRPDLRTIYFNRKEINWPTSSINERPLCDSFFKENHVFAESNTNIETNEIILYSKGRYGALVHPVRIVAENGTSISELEILFQVQRIRLEHPSTAVDRVGFSIDRLGHEKGIPSFFVSNYMPEYDVS